MFIRKLLGNFVMMVSSRSGPYTEENMGYNIEFFRQQLWMNYSLDHVPNIKLYICVYLRVKERKTEAKSIFSEHISEN